MKVWNINTPSGSISVSIEFFMSIKNYEIHDLDDTVFIKEIQPLRSIGSILSISKKDWNDVQIELRNQKIINILDDNRGIQ